MTEGQELAEMLATRLRLAREHSGLSQGQVAKLLGMHRPTVSEIEAGRRKVSAEELAVFSRVYDVSLSWLMCQELEADNEQQGRVQLAARELSKLKPEDMKKVVSLIRMIRHSGGGKDVK